MPMRSCRAVANRRENTERTARAASAHRTRNARKPRRTRFTLTLAPLRQSATVVAGALTVSPPYGHASPRRPGHDRRSTHRRSPSRHPGACGDERQASRGSPRAEQQARRIAERCLEGRRIERRIGERSLDRGARSRDIGSPSRRYGRLSRRRSDRRSYALGVLHSLSRRALRRESIARLKRKSVRGSPDPPELSPCRHVRDTRIPREVVAALGSGEDLAYRLASSLRPERVSATPDFRARVPPLWSLVVEDRLQRVPRFRFHDVSNSEHRRFVTPKRRQ